MERTSLSEGPVTLQWLTEMSAESLDEFEYWVGSLVKKAKRKAGLTGKARNPKE